MYYNELDNHKFYIQTSATLLKVNCEGYSLNIVGNAHQVLLNGNISMPDKHIDFALYNINGVNLLPGIDVFSNPFHCNAHSIADALQYVCEQTVYYSIDQPTEVMIS